LYTYFENEELETHRWLQFAGLPGMTLQREKKGRVVRRREGVPVKNPEQAELKTHDTPFYRGSFG